MRRRPQPITAAAIAVALALVVAALWCRRARPPVAERAVDATVSVRVTRHDAYGMPAGAPMVVRDRERVRSIVEALGIDGHPPMKCPPDYASADLGLQLSGRDVYARRNVYLWQPQDDPGKLRVRESDEALVVAVDSTGCRGGPPADASVLRTLLADLDAANLDAGNSGKRQ